VPPEPEPSPETVPLIYVNTEPNEFGIYRSYPQLPKSIPDEELQLSDVCEGPGFFRSRPPDADPLSVFGLSVKRIKDGTKDIFTPFLNATVFRLMAWFYNSHDAKSLADLDSLVNDVILADDFHKEHLEGFSSKKATMDMDACLGEEYTLLTDDCWRQASVSIPLCGEKVKRAEADAPKLEVEGVHYRKPLEIIKALFQSERSKTFHYTPFKLFQRHPHGGDSDDEPPLADTRLHQEVYNSDAYIQEYENIQNQQQERRRKDPELAKEKDIENVPVAIMAWSDETQVSQFGDRSMWPIYLYFGNQSKYERARPSSFAAHHLAYIPKVCF
jgi:hypothetical protein